MSPMSRIWIPTAVRRKCPLHPLILCVMLHVLATCTVLDRLFWLR